MKRLSDIYKNLLIRHAFTGVTAIIIYLMIINFVFHVATGWQYGLFIDENYYFSMSNHLDFGYVDVTPITAWLMALSRFLLGDSVQAMHVFPALAGSFTMLFAALTAKKMGGGMFAQVITALAVLLAPVIVSLSSTFIYDTFDHLMSAVVVFMAARILTGNDSKRDWMLLGLMAGIGLMVKITMGFLLLSLAVGLLATRERKQLANKWLWISAAIAFTCFVPYIVWQWMHGFPIVDYLNIYTLHRTITPTPWQLFLNVLFTWNPVSVLLWLGGLILLFTKRGRIFRPFAWAFLFYFAFAAVMYIKFYALSGVMMPLVAFGAVCLENNFRGISLQASGLEKKKKFRLSGALKAAYIFVLCLIGIITVPLSVPLLSPADTAAYDRAVGMSRVVSWDVFPSSGIPSVLSLRLGWKELAASVSNVYHSLPDSVQKDCSILCMSYGEAGAIDYYSKEYDLPQPICSHLSCYYWGYGNYDGKCLIIVGMRSASLKNLKLIFNRVSVVAAPRTAYAVFESGGAIYICNDLKIPVDEFWKSIKSVD